MLPLLLPLISVVSLACTTYVAGTVAFGIYDIYVFGSQNRYYIAAAVAIFVFCITSGLFRSKQNKEVNIYLQHHLRIKRSKRKGGTPIETTAKMPISTIIITIFQVFAAILGAIGSLAIVVKEVAGEKVFNVFNVMSFNRIPTLDEKLQWLKSLRDSPDLKKISDLEWDICTKYIPWDDIKNLNDLLKLILYNYHKFVIEPAKIAAETAANLETSSSWIPWFIGALVVIGVTVLTICLYNRQEKGINSLNDRVKDMDNTLLNHGIYTQKINEKVDEVTASVNILAGNQEELETHQNILKTNFNNIINNVSNNINEGNDNNNKMGVDIHRILEGFKVQIEDAFENHKKNLIDRINGLLIQHQDRIASLEQKSDDLAQDHGIMRSRVDDVENNVNNITEKTNNNHDAIQQVTELVEQLVNNYGL